MSLGTPRMEAIPCRTAGWLRTSAETREGSLASEPLEGSLSSRFLTRRCHGVAADVKLLRPGVSCSVSEPVSKALACWGRSSPVVTNLWAFPCASPGSRRGRTSPRCLIAVPWSWSSALSFCPGAPELRLTPHYRVFVRATQRICFHVSGPPHIETSRMMWRTEASSAICSKQGQEGPVLLQVRAGEAGPCGKEQHRESKPWYKLRRWPSWPRSLPKGNAAPRVRD